MRVSLKQKIFLILFGLVIIAATLEFILHVSGWIYHSYRIKKTVVSSKKENVVKILCVGDSFVFGTGAKRGYSLPEQLESMFNENSHNHNLVKVFNYGIPSQNSSQLLIKLPKLIERLNPDIIIVLIGMNDYWNLDESKYYLFKRGVKSYLYRMDTFLTKLRMYKLLKIALINLRNKVLVIETHDRDKSPVPQVIAHIVQKEEKNENYQLATREFVLGESYWNHNRRESSLAIEKFRNTIKLNPNFSSAYVQLADVYNCLGEVSLAIDYLKRLLKIDPYNINARNGLWKLYWKQGMDELAIEEIEKLVPIDQKNADLKHLLKIGLPSRSDKKIFDKLLQYNLKNIIKLTQSNKIELVLQNYPFAHDYNFILKEVSEKYNILFIDNATIFNDLLRQRNYKHKDLFANDNFHCNTKGYRIMAKNIYKRIKEIIK